ncbi:unnamed protein product, partial [Urochloa humidicola]
FFTSRRRIPLLAHNAAPVHASSPSVHATNTRDRPLHRPPSPRLTPSIPGSISKPSFVVAMMSFGCRGDRSGSRPVALDNEARRSTLLQCPQNLELQWRSQSCPGSPTHPNGAGGAIIGPRGHIRIRPQPASTSSMGGSPSAAKHPHRRHVHDVPPHPRPRHVIDDVLVHNRRMLPAAQDPGCDGHRWHTLDGC